MHTFVCKKCGVSVSKRAPGKYCSRRCAGSHGGAIGGKSPEYTAWYSMVRRCHNPRCRSYPSYGGRGIRVCRRWREDFWAFLADIGRRPSSEHSIDRVNNDGNYEPGNVRWATRQVQASNTRRNHMVRFGGRLVTASEAARLSGVNKATVFGRLSRLRDPFVSRERSVFLTFRGETKSIRQWAAALGVSHSVIVRRRKKGLSIDQILREAA